MRFYVNIERKHFYFIIIFVILLSIYVIAPTYTTNIQSHDGLWINNIYGKNTNTINVDADLSLLGKTLQAPYVKTDKLTSNSPDQTAIKVESDIWLPEGKTLRIGGEATGYGGISVTTKLIPGQGANIESVTGCPNCKKISATNFLNYESIQNYCGTTSACTASCPSGKTVISGGCQKGSGYEIITSMPLSSKGGWSCKLSGASPITAYAICAYTAGSEPISCASECSNGAKQCSGTGYQTCADYNNDGCYEWSTITSCAYGCSNGQCVSCYNQCDYSGQEQCSGTGYQTCGYYAGYCNGQVLSWGGVTACPRNTACIDDGSGEIACGFAA